MRMEGVSLRDSNLTNRNYLDQILVEQRLVDAAVPDLHVTLLGKTFSTPVMSAAFSHLDHGDTHYAAHLSHAFQQCGALNWWGMSTDAEMQEIYQAAPDTVEIIKPYCEEERIHTRIDFALAHGALAVGMDIDHAFNRDGFHDRVHELEMEPKSMEQLRKYIGWAGKTPFVVKGVLSVTDALKCRDAGVKAIVVSHHHGIYPFAVPPLMVLPAIREAIGNSMEIYADCGIESGADAFKALCLGADAVGISRHILEIVRASGEEGVAMELQKMNGELRALMARTGMRTVKDTGADVLWNL